jgi:hypothetical protein
MRGHNHQKSAASTDDRRMATDTELKVRPSRRDGRLLLPVKARGERLGSIDRLPTDDPPTSHMRNQRRKQGGLTGMESTFGKRPMRA